jgi:hypothetical protein
MTTAVLTAPKVGDILVSSWGYDQTNVDFYKVVGTTASGKSVKLIRIGQRIVEETGWAQETVVADPTFEVGDAFTRRFKPYGDGYSVKVRDYAWANLWDGRPRHQSHYA